MSASTTTTSCAEQCSCRNALVVEHRKRCWPSAKGEPQESQACCPAARRARAATVGVDAMSKTVFPRVLREERSRPCMQKSLNVSRSPPAAARCQHVLPSRSTSLGLNPCMRRTAAFAAWPCRKRPADSVSGASLRPRGPVPAAATQPHGDTPSPPLHVPYTRPSATAS